MKWTKAKKRILIEIVIVFLVVCALSLMLFFLKKPETFTVEWKNPNKISSSMLVEKAKHYDGRTVTFTGEAVGERMIRNRGKASEGAWIHLNDDAYMYRASEASESLSGFNSGMSVWVTPPQMSNVIKTYGGFKTNGDVVRVSGVFHAACKEHGGDMDIHATSLQVVSDGLPIAHPVSGWKVLIAVAMVLLAAAMWALNKRKFLREKLGNFSKD